MTSKREFIYRDGLTRDYGLIEVRESQHVVGSLRYRRNEQGRLIPSTAHVFLKTDGLRLGDFFDHLSQCQTMPERDRRALRDLRRRFRIVEKAPAHQLTWFACCSRPIEESRARAFPYQGEDFTEEPYHLPIIATTQAERSARDERFDAEWPHRQEGYAACQVEPTDEPWFPRFQPRASRDRRGSRHGSGDGRDRRRAAPRPGKAPDHSRVDARAPNQNGEADREETFTKKPDGPAAQARPDPCSPAPDHDPPAEKE